MTPLPDVLTIKPFTKPVRGEVTLPGSKSITNRALLLAALCDRPVTLTGALFSDDTRIMAEALRRLGIPVTENEAEKILHITGQGGKIPAERAELFVGNAGTAARFLTALCAAAPRGTYKIDGVPQMRKRPMKGLIDALRAQGATITCAGEDGFFPITIEAHSLKGGEVEIDASESSQMLSALLMVAKQAQTPLTLKSKGEVISRPFVAMTERMVAHFKTRITNYAIECDATAASYFLALPLAVEGHLALPGFTTFKSLQGDVQFAKVLQQVGIALVGLDFNPGEEAWIATGAPRRGVTQNFNLFSDTFLTLAAIAPLLEGTTKITGIAHTRKQETDRVAGMARELKKLGQGVDEKEDSLEITPNLDELRKCAAQSLVEIETYDDHRFAMSFAILGCHDLLQNGRPWLSIKNPACCAKTFPNFFDVLELVRQKSLNV
jgi:3-phosphoshikimate 1-carboxyvinyltransferase